MGASTHPLPASPWDSLIKLRKTASEHPGGLIDLSIGAPIDPVPASVTAALASAANSPGYPAAVGSERLEAWIIEERDVTGLVPRRRRG